MDIRHLKYFAETARLLSFSKAANALHVSQPSLSKTIKDLEDELAVPLFYRSSRQLKLTDAGKAFLKNTNIVLEAFNNVTSELTDIMELKKGEICIGIPPIMGAVFFSKQISEYKKAFPLIDITLIEVGSKIIKQRVEDGSLDIGLICNIPLNGGPFEIVKLLKDPLMVVTHKNNRLAALDSIELSQLKDEPFILYRNDFTLHESIIDACARRDFYPIIVCESSQRDFMIEMVEAEIGITLLPDKICQQINNPDLVTIPLMNQPIYLELAMIWRNERHVPFAVREFITLSKKVLN